MVLPFFGQLESSGKTLTFRVSAYSLDWLIGEEIRYSIFIVDVKSGRFMYQSGGAGDEAKKRKSPAKSGRVRITDIHVLLIKRG